MLRDVFQVFLGGRYCWMLQKTSNYFLHMYVCRLSTCKDLHCFLHYFQTFWSTFRVGSVSSTPQQCDSFALEVDTKMRQRWYHGRLQIQPPARRFHQSDYGCGYGCHMRSMNDSPKMDRPEMKRNAHPSKLFRILYAYLRPCEIAWYSSIKLCEHLRRHVGHVFKIKRPKVDLVDTVGMKGGQRAVMEVMLVYSIH